MVKNKLNIIYDISVLGMGTRNPAARTGVFRIIESLLDELLECPEIKISLNASPLHLDATGDYLLQKGHLPAGSRNHRRSGILAPLANFIPNWLRNNHPRPVRLANGSTLSPDEYTGADIFHSPWLPIPPAFATEQKVKKFITVHDLVPVLFPDFVTESNVVTFQGILDSITPDTWVLCSSHSTRNDLLNHHQNIDPDKVFVTYWAASALFRPIRDESLIRRTKAKYQIPDAPYILSLSTIEPRKNIKSILQAFVNLIREEKVRGLNLVLVGVNGWKYQEIMDLIDSSADLASRVIFTGYVDDQDLAGLYSGASAFVYPSFYEGFGLPLLEAMQCGVPVISSNTSSMPEVVGDAGICVAPLDIDGLSHSMMKIWGNPSYRNHLSEQSLLQSQKFSWKNCMDQTLQYYSKSLL